MSCKEKKRIFSSSRDCRTVQLVVTTSHKSKINNYTTIIIIKIGRCHLCTGKRVGLIIVADHNKQDGPQQQST